MLITKSRCCHK